MEREGKAEINVRFLTRFFENEQEAQETVSSMLEAEPDLSKDELFRRVSNGKGMGKNHVSQYTADHKDGTLKKKHRFRERSRRIF